MAFYLVTAKPKEERLGTLLANLRKRTYASMRPYGRALTFALENARRREDGLATWEEEDYCTPPLAQERAAALDDLFDGLGGKKDLPDLFNNLPSLRGLDTFV